MTRGAGFYLGDIKGMDEVVSALNEFKPALYAELVARVKAAAEEVAGAIDGALPGDAPMSGFDHGGRTAWANKGSASAQASGTRLSSSADATQEWPVYKIVLGGYASAVADIAGAGGRGNTAQGENMIAVLNSREGRASRWVWPVAQRKQNAFVNQMQDACDKVSDEVSRRLAARGG